MGNSSTKAKNKYNAKNYDRIGIILPKGKKNEWKAEAEARNTSLNALVKSAVGENLKKCTVMKSSVQKLIKSLFLTGKENARQRSDKNAKSVFEGVQF